MTTWRAEPLRDLARRLTASAAAGPPVVAVDGRGAGGKSTFAARLAAALPGSAVVHTDDVAWNHSVLGWTDELVEGVLDPVRRGEPVRYRPPGWVTHGRAGAITLPAGLSALVVEGVGAGRRSLLPRLDAVVWVASDAADAYERGIRRDVAAGTDGDDAAARAFWDEWMREELPFLEEEAPWARATVVVAGADVLGLGPDEVAVAADRPG